MLMCSLNMNESNLKVICYLWFGATLISLTSCIVTILISAHAIVTLNQLLQDHLLPLFVKFG